MGIKITNEERLAKAAARAEAAAAKCEKLAELLELRLAEADGEPDTLDRIDAQEEAIMELAEIVGGEE